MRKLRIVALALATCMLLALVAACAPSAPPAPAQVAPGTPGVAAVRDTVVITQTAEPMQFVGLCSDFATFPSRDGIVTSNIYETLLYLEHDGRISPMLATGFSMSDDGLVYTFYLRDDVYFHDGYKMTSADVVFTFNTALVLNPTLAGALLTNFTHAVAIDDYTVEFHLSSPSPIFPTNTTTRIVKILSERHFEAVGGSQGYNERPIGTGPYMFYNRVPGESVTLVAHNNHWLGPPQIQTVVIRPIGTIATQFLALESGEVDVIALADIPSCLRIVSPDITWGYTPSSSRVILVFFSAPPRILSDRELRRAIQSAINKEDVLLGVMDGIGIIMDVDANETKTGFPAPGMLDPVPQFNLDAARAHLAASNYNGETLVLAVSSGTPEERAGQIIQGQLLQIGINVEVRSVDESTRLTLSNTGEGIDMIINVAGATMNDVAALSWNYAHSHVAIPRFDPDLLEVTHQLVRAADVELDTVRRQQLAADVLNIVTYEALTIPLYAPVNAAAWRVGLEGVQPHMNGIVYRVRDWSWTP